MQLCYYRFAEPSLVDLSLSLSPCDLPFQSPCDSLRLSFPLIVSGHSPVEMRGSNLKTSSVGQKWESPTVSFRSFRELLLFCSFFFFPLSFIKQHCSNARGIFLLNLQFKEPILYDSKERGNRFVVDEAFKMLQRMAVVSIQNNVASTEVVEDAASLAGIGCLA